MLDPQYRRNFGELTKILADAQFRATRDDAVEMLGKSRANRNDAAPLLHLQAEMAGKVIQLQAQQRDFAKSRSGGDTSSDYEHAIGVVKGMSYVIRDVADGIAWRSLDYDRVMLHELAFAPQTGHIDSTSALAELTEAAQHVVATGDVVILNDLTNCLRYGDFTSIHGQHVGIHEVKAGTASKKDRRAKRQKQRTANVIEFLNRGEKIGRWGKQRLLRTKTIPRSHLSALSSMVSVARSDGECSARLSDCLAVQVFDTGIMAERFAADELDLNKLLKNPFDQVKLSLTSHNLSMFGRFTANAAPISIYPLSDEDCIDILSGRMWVVTYFNLGNLIRCVRRKGLDMIFPDEKEIQAAPKLLPGQVPDHELDHPIRIGRPNGPGMHMSLAVLARMLRELLDEESFADEIVEIIDAEFTEEAILYSAFERGHAMGLTTSGR